MIPILRKSADHRLICSSGEARAAWTGDTLRIILHRGPQPVQHVAVAVAVDELNILRGKVATESRRPCIPLQV